MTNLRHHVLAICTLCALVLYCGEGQANTPPVAENVRQFRDNRVLWGATSLPLAAQVEYRAALAEASHGNLEAAQSRLHEAIRLSPDYPDAYFTLSKIKFRSLDHDALFYFVGGVKAMWRDFHSQGLFVVNVFFISALTLALLTLVVCVAYGVRYLPFVAHRLAEQLRKRTRAAFPRATAYLIILTPFVLFPGFAVTFSLLLLTTWYFMHRREKLTMIVLALPFVGMAASSHVERLYPIADPLSFTTLTTRAMYSQGDEDLVRRISALSPSSLEAEKHNALGLLEHRRENFFAAANHFLKAISVKPNDPTAYVNLGNVYFQQGLYQKALEGYRKAERRAPNDPVVQHNLAEAYTETYLFAEATQAHQSASAAGFEMIKESFSQDALASLQVFPKLYGPAQLWQISAVEAGGRDTHALGDVLAPFTRFPPHVVPWIMLGALILAFVLSRFIKPKHLTFQCSNCGNLACESCCNDERGSAICQRCSKSIAGISSDKVVDALLRQRRQTTLVRRRRAIRWLTLWLPGMRDLFYGRSLRGLFLAGVFAFSCVQLWTRGYLIRDWQSLYYATPPWKWVLPLIGILFSFAMSFQSQRGLEMRNYRNAAMRRVLSSDSEKKKSAMA